MKKRHLIRRAKTIIDTSLVLCQIILLTGCLFSMDSFEPWEVAVTDYVGHLGPTVEANFIDEGHAIAYALAADCFSTREPVAELDKSVEEACLTSAGVLSDVMSMSDLCDYLRRDGNVDAPRINGGQLCE